MKWLHLFKLSDFLSLTIFVVNLNQCPANSPNNGFGLGDPSSLGRRELPDFGLWHTNELDKRAKKTNLFPVTEYALMARLIAWIYQQLVGEGWYAQSPSFFNQIGGNLQNPDGAVIIGPTNNQYQGSELIWRFRALMRLALVARNTNSANYVQQFLSNNLGTDASIVRQYPQSLQQLLIANQNQIPTTQTWAYGTTSNVGSPTPYPNINLPVDSRLRYTQGGHIGPIGYEAALLLAFQVAGVNFAGTIDDMFHVIQGKRNDFSFFDINLIKVGKVSKTNLLIWRSTTTSGSPWVFPVGLLVTR